MPARVRWLWTAVFEAALIIIMLMSSATWPVRGVVIVVGTGVLASMNASWRAYGMPRDGAP
ncbi:hypothetical protein [Conexibacter woesei]|uniref:hypothetical protein n=1 Tax=Conexibacter woesei TaxID=191495 RepID=UPI00041FB557|nr:hypothetical protein [Conexibacter woesei]